MTATRDVVMEMTAEEAQGWQRVARLEGQIGRFATRENVLSVESGLQTEIAGVRADMQVLRSDLREEIGSVRDAVTAVDSRQHQLEKDVAGVAGKLSILVWLVGLGVVGIFIPVLWDLLVTLAGGG